MASGVLFAVLAFSLGTVSWAADQTRQPGGNGANVVDTVVGLIRESCLFADDKRFLRRLAYVQSTDGTDPKTYRPGYDGGIWQVGRNKFLETQNNIRLLSKYNIIQDVFGIDWSHVSWNDLRKPLYSGIAAALYTILKGGVGWRIEEQALFFSNHFLTTSGSNFTNLATILDEGCHGNERIDLVFVVDRSLSLSQDDYIRTKYFVEDVVDDFNIAPDKTQVAVVSYSSDVKVEFYLNSYNDKSSVKTAVDNMVFKGGATATARALDLALNQVFSTAHGMRPYAVKVLIVITDGESDDRLNTMHAAQRIHASNIVTFAIGVGDQINHNELNTIGTQPSCTHVFTVSNYAEIKAMKEEILKSSCRAPVYIPMNHTYTCVSQKCPPLAVVTPPGGVTVETNVTCGSITLYTAFNSPYPGKSFYEVVDTTTPDSPGIQFRNTSTTQTLFMTLQDALEASGSANCVIHITPYRGDHRDHDLKCYQDGIEIDCPDSCPDPWKGIGNPCTKENLLAGNLKFEHPTDHDKFLMCDSSGKLYIVICPKNESYYQSCQQCVGADTPCVEIQTPIPTAIANPCTVANLLAGKFFFTYPNDKHKFIHCDVWGKAWVRPCPLDETWDETLLTCVEIRDDPCRNNNGTSVLYFPYPCDPQKYYQCDLWHESFIRQCNPYNFHFQPSLQQCVPPESYTPPAPLPGQCDSEHNVVTHPTSAQPIISGGIGFPQSTMEPRFGYVYCSSCPPFSEPCTSTNLMNRKVLFPVRGDLHHYIQCDLTGHQYLQPCSNGGRDFFDVVTSTCTDGSLSIDNLIGTGR